MKKAMSLVLALLLVMGVLIPAAGLAQADAPKYKIGVILYSKDDSLGGMCYSLINAAAEALGCEVTFAIGDFDATSQITSAENLIAAGAEGILILPLAETATERISRLCADHGIYLALLLRTINDPIINEIVRGNEYFVGNVLGDDSGNAKELTRIIIEDYQCRKLGMYYAPEGTSMALRNDGMKEAMAEYGAEQLAEANLPNTGDTSEVTTVMQNFVNTNMEMQGIVSASGSTGIGDAIYTALASLNASGVKYACFDTFDNMEAAFDSGYLAAVCGGQAPAALYTFMMLYNAVDGNRLSEESAELLMTYIFIKSAEEAQNFLKYIVNPNSLVYSADEIRAMAVRFNPDFSFEGLKQVMADYTYENVMAKIAK